MFQLSGFYCRACWPQPSLFLGYKGPDPMAGSVRVWIRMWCQTPTLKASLRELEAKLGSPPVEASTTTPFFSGPMFLT